MRINAFTDVEKYTKMSEKLPQIEDSKFTEKEHLRAWLADEKGRDQILTYVGDDVGVNWLAKSGSLEVAHTRRVSAHLLHSINYSNSIPPELDRILHCLVTTGNLPCKYTSSRCSSLGWSILVKNY